MAGRLYVRNDRGALAVELNKAEGQRVDLGLEPGTYNVLLDARNGRLGHSASLVRASAFPALTLLFSQGIG